MACASRSIVRLSSPGAWKSGVFGVRRRMRDRAGADAGGRAFQRMRQGADGGPVTMPHALDQQRRLAVEQLQDFLLKTAVAECHAAEMSAIDTPPEIATPKDARSGNRKSRLQPWLRSWSLFLNLRRPSLSYRTKCAAAARPKSGKYQHRRRPIQAIRTRMRERG